MIVSTDLHTLHSPEERHFKLFVHFPTVVPSPTDPSVTKQNHFFNYNKRSKRYFEIEIKTVMKISYTNQFFYMLHIVPTFLVPNPQ